MELALTPFSKLRSKELDLPSAGNYSRSLFRAALAALAVLTYKGKSHNINLGKSPTSYAYFARKD